MHICNIDIEIVGACSFLEITELLQSHLSERCRYDAVLVFMNVAFPPLARIAQSYQDEEKVRSDK